MTTHSPRYSAAALRALAALAALVLLALAAPPPATAADRPTTVILVRHAEKAQAPPGDPSLSDAGRERAGRLARMLANAGVTAIVTSQYARTKETAAPLAKALGLAPVAVPLENAPGTRVLSDASMNALRDEVLKHAGGTVVVFGHTDSTVALIKRLGGDAEVIPETDFDNLFVVTVPASGPATVVRLTY